MNQWTFQIPKLAHLSVRDHDLNSPHTVYIVCHTQFDTVQAGNTHIHDGAQPARPTLFGTRADRFEILNERKRNEMVKWFVSDTDKEFTQPDTSYVLTQRVIAYIWPQLRPPLLQI